MKLTTSILCVALMYSQTAEPSCVLKMGYKYGAKLPLIQKAPANSGVYVELFKIAAKRIGCNLLIVRMKKTKLHLRFAAGTLDFYPGASYSYERAKYLHYIKNGLETSEYGITPLNIATIRDYSQVKSLGLIWLQEIGSSKKPIATQLNISVLNLNSVSIKVIQRFFAKDRAQFVVVDQELYDYFLKTLELRTLLPLGLKVHKNCCGGVQPMYLGFSKYSKHYAEEDNPHYDPNRPVGITNKERKLAKTSIAYQLQQTLTQMKQSGLTKKIYQKYFLENSR